MYYTVKGVSERDQSLKIFKNVFSVADMTGHALFDERIICTKSVLEKIKLSSDARKSELSQKIYFFLFDDIVSVPKLLWTVNLLLVLNFTVVVAMSSGFSSHVYYIKKLSH